MPRDGLDVWGGAFVFLVRESKTWCSREQYLFGGFKKTKYFVSGNFKIFCFPGGGVPAAVPERPKQV